MAETWCKLTTRFGKEVRSPDKAELQKALAEVLNEKIPGLTEADYAEHPSAWVTYGVASGAMYMLDVYRRGRVVFATYADRDDVDPGEEYEITKLDPEEIAQLWQWLCDGDIARVRSMPWRVT